MWPGHCSSCPESWDGIRETRRLEDKSPARGQAGKVGSDGELSLKSPQSGPSSENGPHKAGTYDIPEYQVSRKWNCIEDHEGENGEPFVRTICVFSALGIEKPARATFDTAATQDWVSQRFVEERLGLRSENIPEEKPGIYQFDGTEIWPNGKVRLLWYFGEDTKGRRTFEGDFLIHPQRHFDILVGSKTIFSESILRWNPSFVWPNEKRYKKWVAPKAAADKQEQLDKEEKARKKREAQEAKREKKESEKQQKKELKAKQRQKEEERRLATKKTATEPASHADDGGDERAKKKVEHTARPSDASPLQDSARATSSSARSNPGTISAMGPERRDLPQPLFGWRREDSPMSLEVAQRLYGGSKPRGTAQIDEEDLNAREEDPAYKTRKSQESPPEGHRDDLAVPRPPLSTTEAPGLLSATPGTSSRLLNAPTEGSGRSSSGGGVQVPHGTPESYIEPSRRPSADLMTLGQGQPEAIVHQNSNLGAGEAQNGQVRPEVTENGVPIIGPKSGISETGSAREYRIPGQWPSDDKS